MFIVDIWESIVRGRDRDIQESPEYTGLEMCSGRRRRRKGMGERGTRCVNQGAQRYKTEQ